MFARFLAIYGARFTRLWAGADPEEVKRTWDQALRRFDLSQITRAVELCASDVENPPNLPEFIGLVRQQHIDRPGSAAAPALPYVGRDDRELRVIREYPREAGPPYRFWAKRILRLRELGAYVHFRSVEVAKEVLHVRDLEEFAAKYPPGAA